MKKIWRVVFLALVLAALFTVYRVWGEDILFGYHESRARSALSAGQIDEAIRHTEWLLDKEPDHKERRMSVVDLYLQKSNYTRAEYHLQMGIRTDGGETEYYVRLSGLFLKQNKLLDALALLDNIMNPFAREEIAAMRPAKPVVSFPPGRYEEEILLKVTSPDNCPLLITTDADVPSVQKTLTSPFMLSAGQTVVRAVAIASDGLVSPLFEGEYRLENLNALVHFQDAALEAQVRALLSLPEGAIHSDALWDVQSLVIPEAQDYTTLNDLVWFPALTELSLRGKGHRVSFEFLASLPKLTSLTLRNMNMDSIDCMQLAALDQLTHLDLQENRIGDLTAFSALTGLTHLTLSGNLIIDLTPLGDVTKLTHLDITNNAVETIDTLASLSMLESVTADQNHISDIRGLMPLVNLTTLSLRGNRITDVSALASCRSLVTLQCADNRIETLLPLAGLTVLTTVDAADNRIKTYAYLAQCSALQTLVLTGNPLTETFDVLAETSIDLQADPVEAQPDPDAESLPETLPVPAEETSAPERR